MSAMFEAVDVTKTFGGLTAGQRVTFTLDGGIASIIGPNGAGKTTLFNVFTGLYPPDGGSVSFRGQALVGLRPDEITALGVCRTFQNIRLFANMTAAENVLVGMHARIRARPAPARRADRGHDAGGGRDADGAAPAARRRAEPRHRPHRAQHAGGDGGLGPRHRARPRREDRRGSAARRPGRPARDRGVPRSPCLPRPRRAVTMLALQALDVHYGEIHPLRGVALE